jgi:hypothetical protein
VPVPVSVAGALGSYGYGKRGGKRWWRGTISIVVVIIDDLEEPSDLVWR